MRDDGRGLPSRQQGEKRQAEHQNMFGLAATGARLIDGRVKRGVDIDGREGWRIAGKAQPLKLFGKGGNLFGLQQYAIRNRWGRYCRIGAQDH
ncbi:hypothetical protein [Agrobacterium sp. M50-1]|uniref:hypothetical protein n=1 Tax=Agrobacterium sp. M50-1 TaxID=3132821 RepID=UPI003CE4B6CF